MYVENASFKVPVLILAVLVSVVVLLAAPPQAAAVSDLDVDITQEGQNLVVTVDNPDGHVLTWQYAAGVPVTDCGPGLTTDFTDGSPNLIGSDKLSLEIEANSYCFKITDENDGNDVWSAYQLAPVTDDQGPGIHVARNRNNSLVISSSDTDLDSATWRYARFDHNPDCESEDGRQAFDKKLNSRSSNVLALRESDNGNWYCFKAADDSGNTTFVKYEITGVDTTAPTVSITQNGRLLSASAATEEPAEWHYVFSPSDIDCNDGTFLNNRSIVAGNPVTLTSDRIDYYYCFRATDRVGNAGFGKYRVESIDFLAPKISLKKINLTLRPSSDQAIVGWHYVKSASVFDCGRQTDFSSATDFSSQGEIKLAEADHLKYFCVRGFNATNVAGFARLRVDARIPSVKLKLDGTSITASAGQGNLDWEYLKTETELDCDHGDDSLFEDEFNFDKHKGNASQLSELDNELWFCFRAVDETGGNYGYAKQQISGITAKAPGDSGGGSRGQLDVLIIAGVLILVGGGFLTYVFLQKKKQLAGKTEPVAVVEAERPVKKRRRRRRKDGAGPTADSDIVQPLDYLKKEEDEEK
ncbi:hypothetical protein F4X86_04355 [Candidatus Saccharibacteria bacterium]|nr:hypothetical protein [Candidatus Saccharibacteria bacterium]